MNNKWYINIKPDSVKDLEKLMTICDFKNKAELLDTSIALLEWAAEEVLQGKRIGSVDPKENTFMGLSVPAFDNIKRLKK